LLDNRYEVHGMTLSNTTAEFFVSIEPLAM